MSVSADLWRLVWQRLMRIVGCSLLGGHDLAAWHHRYGWYCQRCGKMCQ